MDLAFLPCLWVSWTILGIMLCLVLTVIQHHADSLIIRISDTGRKFPESAISVAVIFFSALLEAATSYSIVRYHALLAAKEPRPPRSIFYYMNIVMDVLGVIVAIFLLVAPMVHLPRILYEFGDIADFTIHTLHITCETIHIYESSYSKRVVSYLRMAISLVMDIHFTTYLACHFLHWSSFAESHHELVKMAMAVIEWVMFACIQVYNALYVMDLQNVAITIKRTLKEDWLALREREDYGLEIP